jgi:hypothetical protein
MSLRDCIEVGKDVGALTKEQADNAAGLFDELVAEYTPTMGVEQAQLRAAKDTVEILKTQTSEKARVRQLQIKSWNEVTGNLYSFKNGEDLGQAAQQLLNADRGAKYSGVENRRQAVAGIIHSKMDNVLAAFRRKGPTGVMGNKDVAVDLIKVAFGEATENKMAKELYDSWAKSIEYARTRFNRAGGSIPKMEGWGLPQMHDPLEVRKATYDVWRSDIGPLLDTNKMLNPLTKLPFTAAQLEDALKASYEAIISDGWSKVKENETKHSSALYNKGKNHRFLVFKDADSWMAYQDKYGNSHPFITMMNYVDNMARDIAMIEVLGPNPNATIRNIKALVRRDAEQKDLNNPKGKPNTNKAIKDLKAFDAQYGIVNGSSNAPIDGTLARAFAGTRSLLTSVQLGAATLSALTDVAYQRTTAAFNGMGEGKLLKQIVKQMNPFDVEERGRLAIRSGLIAENWINLASGQARYVGDLTAPEIAQRMSDTIMRVSLLSPWTQAGKWAFGMEFMGTFADNVGKSFKELDPPLQNALKRSGLDVSWDVIRKAEVYEFEGAKVLRPEEIAEIADLPKEQADLLATKFLELINAETNFAVPSSSIRGRASLVGETQAGTFIGEVARSIALYKNFPVTLMNTHIMRTLSQQDLKAKSSYAAGLLISTTLMGGLALQMKEMAKGRDPRPMTDKKFWGSALLQGGGLGIYGDFIFSDLNRFGNSFSQTLIGPVGEFIGDTLKLTAGNVQELLSGKDTNFTKEAVKFGTKYLPFQSLWYARLALERLLLENLQKWADPRASQKMREIQTKYKKETGQDYWWEPGEMSPDRAPDASAIFEQPPQR